LSDSAHEYICKKSNYQSILERMKKTISKFYAISR
jgi:hypothetical protein